MRSDKALWKIVMDIYKQAYKEASPSADLDVLIKTGKVKKDNWFMDYYLPETEYKRIVESRLKKNKVTPLERNKIMMDIYLGAGPSCVKKSDRL